MFPISKGPDIPWDMLTPHEAQAQQNHSQTLERLAQRGGLAACEAVWILQDRSIDWDELRAKTNEDWVKQLTVLLDAWIASPRGELARMRELLDGVLKLYDELHAEVMQDVVRPSSPITHRWAMERAAWLNANTSLPSFVPGIVAMGEWAQRMHRGES